MSVRSEVGAVIVAVVLAATVIGAGAADTPSANPPAQKDLFQSLSLGSRKEPIQIDADALELDYKGSTILYKGNVRVRQGDVTLTSNLLTIRYDSDAGKRAKTSGEKPASSDAPVATAPGGAGSIKEIVAEGDVKITQGDRIAEGRRAVFDREKQTIVLSDRAVLHEGRNQVAGDRIVVYLKEERSVVESGGNSRVTAVLYPGSEEGGDKEEKGDKKAVPPVAQRDATPDQP